MARAWWWLRLAWWQERQRHYAWASRQGRDVSAARKHADREVHDLQLNRP